MGRNDKLLEKEVLSIADYLGCNGPELWSELKPVFTKVILETGDEFLKIVGKDEKPTGDDAFDTIYAARLARNLLRQEIRADVNVLRKS